MSSLCRNDDHTMRRRGYRIRLLIVAVLFGLTGPYNSVFAADWEILPIVNVGAQYQSNPRFNTRDSESATGLFVDASIPIKFVNPRTQASLSPKIQSNFYRKEINQDIERDNYFLDGNVQYGMLRSGFGATARYRNQDLISSEFNDGSGSGGQARNDTRQITWEISPYWAYQLSPANSTGLNGAASQVRFSPSRSGRFDYDFTNLSATFEHVFNVKNTIELRANFSKFDSFQPGTTFQNDSTTNGLSAIVSNNFSDTLRFTANLGWARTQSEVTFPPVFTVPGQGDFCFDATRPPCISKSDSTNFVGDLALQKSSKTIQYYASIGQTITPSSNGSEVIRRTLRGNFNKDFRRNFSAALNFTAYRQTDVGATEEDGSSLNRRRDYVRTQASVSWKFRRELALSASYRYTWSEQSGFITFAPGTIIDNTIFIGLSYNGKGWL
jgi:hypothetical protein